MRLLAFDLASRTGLAYGSADCALPQTMTWHLRVTGEPLELAARNLGCRLRDRLALGDVDEIWVEDFLDPQANRDTKSVQIGVGLRYAVEAISACYDVPVHAVNVQQARIAFAGRRAYVPARRPGSPPKSDYQKQKDRLSTKAMIWRCAVRQGFFDAGAREDFDQSDAVCIWSFGAVKRGRTPPLSLELL